MTGENIRAEARKKVLIPARAFDITKSLVIKCVIRDASKGGCMIVSSRVRELPEQILLETDIFKGVRKGEIVWRGLKSAGVRFV